MAAEFPNLPEIQNDPRTAIVSFLAGKMAMENRTVTADPRKGYLEIVISPEDELVHLQWRLHGSRDGEPEIDRIMFPGDAELVKVNSTPDRVYVLKWREGDDRLFFWMQSPDASTDEDNVAAVNRFLTLHATETQGASAENAQAETELHEVPIASSAPQPVETDQTGDPAVTLETLQCAMAMATENANTVTPTISDLVHPDVLGPALESPEFQPFVSLLAGKLLQQDREPLTSLREVLKSQPLRNQAAALTNALASGSCAELLASFGLPADAGANAMGAAGIQAFLRSLKKVPRRKQE